MHSPKQTLFEIEGIGVNVASQEDAIASVLERLKQPGSFRLCTLNLDHLVKLRSDPEFRVAYREAEFVTADGFPIVTLASLDDVSITRVTGSDLIEPLCRAAAAARIPVFFFGTTLPTLCAGARRLTGRIPELDIRGVYSPPPEFSLQSDVAEEAIAVISQSGARLCFVALSAPLEEIFGAAAARRTSGIAFLGIGGGVDFIAGMQVRCPPWLRRLNLEWAWRLGSSPRRLGGRYLRCAVLFATLLVKRLLRRKPGSPARDSR